MGPGSSSGPSTSVFSARSASSPSASVSLPRLTFSQSRSTRPPPRTCTSSSRTTSPRPRRPRRTGSATRLSSALRARRFPSRSLSSSSTASTTTSLIESKKAQLVLIAHDVDPLELVLWLPTLCTKMGVPFAVVKNKAMLGQLTNKKSATCVAVTRVKDADKSKFSKLLEGINASYLPVYRSVSRKWGGSVLGLKSQAKIDAQRRAIERELAKKANM